MKFKRIFLIVLDSLGVGEAIDAEEYNDKGANTLGHLIDKTDLFIPNLKKLGLINTLTMNNQESESYYTIARPKNHGKDCVSSHYEIMGINVDKPFETFNYGPFPRILLESIASTVRKPIIGNIVCGASDAISRLAKRQIETKSLIIYTTGDSNLEVAADERIIPVNELYDCCEKIRDIVNNSSYQIAEVVARPYIYENDTVKLTNDVRIYTLPPSNKSVGSPTPIKYLGLSSGKYLIAYSIIFIIVGLSSPTEVPPIE